MAFNHYAKIKRILDQTSGDWFIKRIDAPTRAKNFKGEAVYFDHYYRIYDGTGAPIAYCKFQQIDLLARALGVPADDLPIVS